MTSTLSFALLVFVALLTACSSTKKQFGQVLVRKSTDTTRSKQEIARIRALDNDHFEGASFEKGSMEIKYRLFKPNQQQSKDTPRHPLVVVYHSSGRPVGRDNKAQLGILPKLFASPQIQKSYPAYVLAPQFSTRSSDYVMDTTRGVLCSIPRPCLESVWQLIDSLKSSLPIDHERIYAVGFSMGASTVINSLSARADLFAAGISIAGIPQFDKLDQLRSTPIWLIHGVDDTENPITSDERFYKEMPSRILFWKLADTTHDTIFTTQLLGETLPQWLFNHRKK